MLAGHSAVALKQDNMLINDIQFHNGVVEDHAAPYEMPDTAVHAEKVILM